MAICALTFRRPDGLRRLLRGLDRQQFCDSAPDVTVIIVDNDPDRSAEAVCNAERSSFRWRLNYVNQPKRGIAPSRNAALRNIDDGADFGCFIDDDEVPEPGWLAELLRVQSEYDADVVSGPVVPHFPDPVEGWIVEGGFLNQQRYATGERTIYAYTNNVMFRWDKVRAAGFTFDERLALIGGEDWHFFKRLRLAGHSLVWADDAVVREWIPSSRANRKWIVQRMFRAGNCSPFVELAIARTWFTRALLAAKGFTWVGIGLLKLPWGLLTGTANRVRAIRELAYGAGMLWGLLGVPYEEYKTIHKV